MAENRYGYDYPDLTSDDSRDINRLLGERANAPVRTRPKTVSAAVPRPALGTNLHGYDYPALRARDSADILQLLARDDAAARRRAIDAATPADARAVEKSLSGLGTPSAEEARQREAEVARKANAPVEEAHWCFLDPQGACQGPYHRLQMRFWFEKGYFEMKTPVRFGLDGAFRMLGDVFGAEAAGEYVLAFLDAAAIATQRASPAELAELFSVCPEPCSPWSQERTLTAVSSAIAEKSSSGGLALAAASLADLSDFPRGVRTSAPAGYVTLPGWLAQWSLTTLLQRV